MSGSGSQLLSPSGEKSTHILSRDVGRKSRLTQQRHQSQACYLSTGHRNSRTDLWFLVGCWTGASWLQGVILRSPGSCNLGAATSRPVPATLLAALRHPAQAVKLLRVQSRHPACPALPTLHLSRASSGQPSLLPGVASPCIFTEEGTESILAFLVQGRGNFESLDDK